MSFEAQQQQHGAPSWRCAARHLCVTAPLLLLALWLALELQRPDVLVVGPITVDLVEGGGRPTGGAVSFAAVAAHALGATTCVVTAAGPEADLGVLDGTSRLVVLPARETLTFEHTYAWWGHSRRLRVTANPNVTIHASHVPWRCRLARVVLLGPLTLHDVDAASFAEHTGLWAWLNPGQAVALLGQGLQRALGPAGEVQPLAAPSEQLVAGLSPRVALLLSDVETDSWSQEALARVVAAAGRVVITQGDKGAEALQLAPAAAASGAGAGGSTSSSAVVVRTKIPPVKVAQAVDSNGAGDTFATVFMLALLRGDECPQHTASWAASRAVLQPQACKPRCTPRLIVRQPGGSGEGLTRISRLEHLQLAAAPLLRQAARVAAGGLEALQLGDDDWCRRLRAWPGVFVRSGGPCVQQQQRLKAV